MTNTAAQVFGEVPGQPRLSVGGDDQPEPSADVSQVLHRAPRSFATWASDNRTAFTG